MAVSLRAGHASRIGPYQLLARIGEGGMGTVYLAKMAGGLAGVNKLAVVKVLRADLVDSPEFVAMFLDEARLAARLTHPNVVHTYGADDSNGRLYIAMEHLDGQPWARVRHRLWANRTLPLAMHLKVLADTLAGLHYAHELQDFSGLPLDVVHCDMSPQNVFVTYDGQVKVVDFGVARAAHFSRNLRPDLFFGKLSYCAPEQARGEAVDRRADVFAVGVMLWEALTGRRFASGNDTSEIRRVRVAGSEPRAREVSPRIPRVLGDICDRALAISPHDRFASAADFREHLLSYLTGHWRDSDGHQLGGLVAEAFEDERIRTRALVQRRLDDRHDEAPIEDLLDDSDGSLLGENTLPADLSELASVSLSAQEGSPLSSAVFERTRPTSSERVVVAPARKAWLWPTAAVALVLAAAGAWALLATRSAPSVLVTPTAPPGNERAAAPAPASEAPRPEPRGQAPATAGPEVPSPRAGAAIPKIELVLGAEPLDAELALDGETLPSNPVVLHPERDDLEHVLSASAPGYRPAQRSLRFDADGAVTLSLVPIERDTHDTRDRARKARRERRAADARARPVPPVDRERDLEDETMLERAGPKEMREIYDEVPF